MLLDSELWISDLDEIINNFPILAELENRNVLVTGATGLICSAFVDVLIRYNETHENRIGVCVAGRSLDRVRARYGDYANKSYFRFVEFDASNCANMDCGQVDYIIHGAGNAYPGLISKEPVETMLGNFDGVKCLLDYAREHKVRRVLYLSSSEVYGRKDNNEPFTEDEYGYIDILNPRNSYSVAKRAAETLCISYAEEYGVDSVIVRPGHIYGPTATTTDNRVSSAWAYSAARGETIVMKSGGEQIRSYCYCLDCASAILQVLLRGETSHAYNISNSNSVISIRQMAQMLADVSGVELHREIASPTEAKSFNPMSNSSLNSEMLESLGWKGLFDARRGFGHTVEILKK